MAKPSRNDPCPCNSGNKYKKCCGAPGAQGAAWVLPHTQADRESVFAKLDAFVEELVEEEDAAFEEFWGRYPDREDDLPGEFLDMSNEVEDMWFAFDYELESGLRAVDLFLEQVALGAGERSFVRAMGASSMRLYDVAETVPGSSVTLRDIVEGGVVTVAERTASRMLVRHECVAARVLPRGSSGQPELERGLFRIPALVSEALVAAVKQQRAEFLEQRGGSLDDFYKSLPPLYHDAWLTCFFDPPVPKLANTDGEAMVSTRIAFRVLDQAGVVLALDGAEGRGLSRSGQEAAWSWGGKNAKGEEVGLGTVRLDAGVLRAEANSVERGARLRALLEELAGQALEHQGTVHEDMRRKVKELASARALGKADAEEPAPSIDPDLAEALVAEHYAKHYREWLELPVPALDGATPRDAAKSRELRPRVEDLIRGLEGMYEQALKAAQPAYDPSWMWAELGLAEEADASNPPPLAHERVAERVPGSAAASRDAAERFRARPAFEDASTTLDEDDLRGDLELQRFLRRERNTDNDAGAEPELAAPFMPLMVNLDLHRRKGLLGGRGARVHAGEHERRCQRARAAHAVSELCARIHGSARALARRAPAVAASG